MFSMWWMRQRRKNVWQHACHKNLLRQLEKVELQFQMFPCGDKEQKRTVWRKMGDMLLCSEEKESEVCWCGFPNWEQTKCLRALSSQDEGGWWPQCCLVCWLSPKPTCKSWMFSLWQMGCKEESLTMCMSQATLGLAFCHLKGKQTQPFPTNELKINALSSTKVAFSLILCKDLCSFVLKSDANITELDNNSLWVEASPFWQAKWILQKLQKSCRADVCCNWWWRFWLLQTENSYPLNASKTLCPVTGESFVLGLSLGHGAQHLFCHVWGPQFHSPTDRCHVLCLLLSPLCAHRHVLVQMHLCVSRWQTQCMSSHEWPNGPRSG